MLKTAEDVVPYFFKTYILFSEALLDGRHDLYSGYCSQGQRMARFMLLSFKLSKELLLEVTTTCWYVWFSVAHYSHMLC